MNLNQEEVVADDVWFVTIIYSLISVKNVPPISHNGRHIKLFNKLI